MPRPRLNDLTAPDPLNTDHPGWNRAVHRWRITWEGGLGGGLALVSHYLSHGSMNAMGQGR